MQRRAAAAYVALFVLVAAGAYAVVATAQAPAVSVDDPDHTLAADETFTAGGTTYTVSEVSAGDGEDAEASATVTWNASVQQSMTLSDGDVVARDGRNWTVEVPNGTDPSTFTLVENRSVDAPTREINGTVYVVLPGEGDEKRLVPRERYLREQFGEPETLSFQEGEAYNDTADVESVANGSATITWTGPEERSVRLAEGDTATLGGTEYVASFEGSGEGARLLLSSDLDAYQRQVDERERFRERVNGFWAVVIMSALTAILLLAIAYMPIRR